MAYSKGLKSGMAQASKNKRKKSATKKPAKKGRMKRY